MLRTPQVTVTVWPSESFSYRRVITIGLTTGDIKVFLNTKTKKIVLMVLARLVLLTGLPRMHLGHSESWHWSRLAWMQLMYP